jgi:cytochrome c556
MRSLMKKATIAAATFYYAVSATAGLALANGAEVKYRQQVMVAIGGHAAAIATIIKSKMPLTDAVAIHAEAVAASAAAVPASFQAEIADGATDAKPEIWASMEDFLALNDKMREASLQLAEVAKGGDPKATRQALGAFSKSCGACHKAYRKPKEESYKEKR